MADTFQHIAQDVFEQMKVYAPGVTIIDADAQRALRECNTMLDEWSNDTLTCIANLEQNLQLQIGKQQYTVGSGGDLNGPRPLQIRTGPGAAYLMDSNNIRYQVNVIEQDQWNQIGLLTVTSQLPDTLFYDPQFPLGLLNVFPLPLAAYNLYFDSRIQFADIAGLATQFSLPPGFMSAIKNNLVIRLWPFYKTGDPTPLLIGLATDSLAKVKRTNIRQSPSQYDAAVVSKAKSSYNIYSDSFNRVN